MTLTIDRMLRDRARLTPNRVAIESLEGDWTYADLERRSDELAASIEPGSRVSTLTGNTAEHVAVFYACAKAGACLHPISWRLAPAEVAFQLDDAEPAVFLVEDEQRPLAEVALELAAVRPPLELGARASSSRAPEPSDPLLLIYTSGTTGKPKGALLTQANCFWTNLSFDLATGIGQHDVVLQVLPQFHVGGWNVQAVLGWWKGARVLLERGFDAARCVELIETRGVTTMMGVPANYLLMAQEPRFASADLSSLRLAVVGVPDVRGGEVGAAYVVVRVDVDDEELRAWCTERLARFKVPKSFHRIDALPRNSLGKVMKSELGQVVA
jgi:fatty-acyl-CoA synthase